MVLLAALLLSSITSCGENTQETESNNANNPTESASPSDNTDTVEETELSREDVADDLPELNYNGQEIIILARSKDWFSGEMYVEEINGDTLNDAVYNRDTTVEERLGVVINYQLESDTNSLVNKNVTAGVDEYGMHVGSAVDTVQYGIKNNYYNLLGDYPEYLNLEQPWWSQYYTEQSSIDNVAFFATGDLCFSLIKLAFVTYVNLNMIENYGLENPYELVREGKWTFDKEMEMAASASEDVNGNGVMDKNDIYGMSIGGDIGCDVYWSAFDLSICTKDDNDIPTFNVDEDKMSSVIEKIYNAYMSDFVYTPTNNSDLEQDEIALMLSEDRMLFSPLRIMHTDQLREMESSYGLIPLPKWDEVQSNYYTFVHDQYSIVGIPISVQDPSMVSAVMEAMAAESYRYVTPAYYDVVLNGQYLRDKDSSEMLEIAMDGIKIDFGWIHTYSLGSCSQALLRDIITSKSNNFSSVYARMKKVYEKKMEMLLEDIYELKDNT